MAPTPNTSGRWKLVLTRLLCSVGSVRLEHDMCAARAAAGGFYIVPVQHPFKFFTLEVQEYLMVTLVFS